MRRPRPMKPHGTTTRYKRGCRCPQCREANTAYHRRRRSAGTVTDGEQQKPELFPWDPVEGRLPVECWCQREVVEVEVEEIQRLRTGSCGAPDCRPSQDRSA